MFEDEINEEQLGVLPYPDLKAFIDEYETRTSKEAILAKDAGLLDQILLLKEYEWSGNKEASLWLHGKGAHKRNAQIEKLTTDTARQLGELMYRVNPSDWWNALWTSKNRG